MLRSVSAAVSSLVLVAPPAGGHGSLPQEVEDGLVTITEEEISAHIHFLASPALEGRDSPSVGLTLAAERIAKTFREAGLVAVADASEAWSRGAGSEPPEWSRSPGSRERSTYLRPYRLTERPGRRAEAWWIPDPGKSALELVLGDDAAQAFEYGTDFIPLTRCPGDVRGALVWGGYGITDTKERYDDFRGLDARDKIVMILEGEPRHKRKFNGPDVTANAFLWNKLDDVAEAGARGVIVVREPRELVEGLEQRPPLAFRYTYASFQPPAPDRWRGNVVPGVEVSAECASELLGRDVLELATKIDKAGRPTKVKVSGRTVSLRSTVTEGGDVRVDNVVGVVPGTDLADEFVVVGAHYDHIGVGRRGRIGLGADDNASGTACLLEIAEAMAVARPRRSVLFVAFSAEEDGLIGSKRFVEDSPVSAGLMVAMVNLDMVGRGDEKEVVCLGFGQNPGMKKVVTRASKLARTGVRKITQVDNPGLFQRSDHFSFHEVGVPVVFFMEGYPLEKNKDYHTWRDTPDLVDTAKATATARLAFLTAWILATDDERLPAPGD